MVCINGLNKDEEMVGKRIITVSDFSKWGCEIFW